MLTGLIILLYTFLVSFLSGTAFLSLQRKLTGAVPQLHSSVLLLLGLAFDALLLQFFHLIHAVDLWAHMYVLFICTLILWNDPDVITDGFRRFKADWFSVKKSSLFLIILVIVALVNLIARAGTGDIGDYHLQAIQWDEHYPVVKGLGNLIRQLGNNSAWFMLHAYFGFGFLSFKSVYALNTFLLIVSAMYFLPAAGKENRLLKAIVFFYILLMCCRKYVGSVTNDYAITIFTLVIFTEWLESSQQQHARRFPLLFLLLMLPVFKLSAVVMLVFVFLVLLHALIRKETGAVQFTLLLIGCGMLVYTPWLITNIMKSGYLCYPVNSIDLFHFDWKMPAEVLEFERRINLTNERTPGIPMREAMQMPFTTWVVHWVKHLDYFSLFLLGFFGLFISLIPVLFLLSQRMKLLIRQKFSDWETQVIFLVILVAMPVWFFNAPATRFVFGYLVFVLGWGIQFIMMDILKTGITLKDKTILTSGAIVVSVSVILFMHFQVSSQRIKGSLIRPLPYGTQQTTRMELKKGFVNVPEVGQQCWDAPIPCAAAPDSLLEWRGEELTEGFRLRRP